MNLGLFMPKKDQCDKCSAYNVGNLSKEDYDDHIVRKEEARMAKAQDKKRMMMMIDDLTILMCAQKLTDASLIYRTEPKTKTSKMKN